jgi:hypothetical protein
MLPAPTPQRPAAPVSYARMLIRAQRRFHALNGAVPPLEDSLSHLWERVGVRARRSAGFILSRQSRNQTGNTVGGGFVPR